MRKRLSKIQIELSNNQLDRMLRDRSMKNTFRELGDIQIALQSYDRRHRNRKPRGNFRRVQTQLGLENKDISEIRHILEKLESHFKSIIQTHAHSSDKDVQQILNKKHVDFYKIFKVLKRIGKSRN